MTPTMFSMTPAAPPPWERALVTAGAGFLGSHLCERLLGAGVEVTCVDGVPAEAALGVAHLAAAPRFRYVRQDIERPDCRTALAGPYDLVLHLACPAASAARAAHPPATPDGHSPGTRNALAVAARDGARFLLVSTCEAGAHRAHDAARCSSETLTTAFVTAKDADAGIVRLFPAYGPRMEPEDGPLIPTLIRQALSGTSVTVPGDGDRRPSLCYVDDTVDGVLLVAASRSVRPVDIGAEPTETVAGIARRVIALTGSHARLECTGTRTDEPGPPLPATGFAHEIFGWTPRVLLDDGLKRTVADFLDRPARSRPPTPPNAGGGGHLACSW
ncbi:NAD-dependent epimerase/dehydratase family protein [Streptomyces sp. NPDC005900]|uniref:NAD-dependent epimerase/dehydratase family protein n=1 Tax=unclassified Streptomyces TaxID=2593676 RepID=UPI0033E64D16